MSPSPAGPSKQGKAVFTITIPPKVNAGTRRAPHYISPSTQSMAVTVNGGSPAVANLTTGSPACTQSDGNLSCVVDVTAPIASDTFDVKLYSGTNATGSVLAHTVVVEQISANTPINIVMNGVASSVMITVGNPSPTEGSQVQIPVNVTVMDSSGNIISGPGNYDTPVTLTDSDTSGHTQLSTTSVTGPSTVVTLNYDGSSAVSTVTISAQTGNGVTSVTPAVIRPVNSQNNGNGGVGVVTINGNVYAEVPSAIGLIQVPLTSGGALRTTPPSPTPGASSAPATLLSISGGVDSCTDAASGSQINLYCVNVTTSTSVDVINVTSGTPVMAGSLSTDVSTLNSNSFSGGSCSICGLTYDSHDQAILLAVAAGATESPDYYPGQFEFYSLSGSGQTRPTIPVFSLAENVGYNAVTNQIWNAGYDDWELVDVASGNVFQSLDLAGYGYTLNYIDANSADVSTNLLLSVDEGSYSELGGVDLTFIPLNGATFASPTPSPTSTPTVSAVPRGRRAAAAPAPTYEPEGSFTSVAASTFDLPTQCLADALTVDSDSHIAFLSGEYSDPDCVAAVALPSAAASSPFTPSNYMMVQSMPNTPDGIEFDSALDPHVAATFYSPAGSDLYGLIYNYQRSWVAVVDITKLLAAPNTQLPHVVDSTYDLVGKGVITYLPTGYSPGPASNGDFRVRGLHRRFARRH